MIKSLLLAAAGVMLVSVPALACTNISSATVKLTGCVDEQWQAGKPADAVEFTYLTSDQNYGLEVITEKDAFTGSQFHDAILANATAAVGGKADDVKVVSERIENIDGKPFNVLEYTIANGGNPILFQNFYFAQPGLGSVQIVGFSLATEAATMAFKTGQFAGTVKLGD